MKTVLTKEIDGLEIVIGFDEAVIDKEATKTKVKEILDKYNETIAFIEEKGRYETLFKDLIRESKKQNNSEKIQNLNKQLEQSQQNMIDKIHSIARERERILPENLIYFEPKPGEFLIDDTEAEGLIQKYKLLDDETLLTRDGKIKPNHKDREYWTKNGKWKCTVIDKIGIDRPEKSITMSEADPEQRAEIGEAIDSERIALLSPGAREAEKVERLAMALSEAAHKRSMFEIQGSTEGEALEKSQAWYQEQEKMIEEKYK